MALRTLPNGLSFRNLHPMALLPQQGVHRQAPPEMFCSVNGFFYVGDKGDKFQATGRGFTPAEAAQNLKETMAATLEALAPPVVAAPAPQSREAQIAALLTCGLRKAMQVNDMGLVERLAKAAAIVLSGGVELSNRPGALAVRSQSNPETTYEVEGKLCTCQDSQRHQDRVCKHVLAAAMWQRLTE